MDNNACSVLDVSASDSVSASASAATAVTVDGEPRASDEASLALRGRAVAYRLLSELFISPLSQDQLDALCVADLGALEDVNDDMDAGLNDMRRYLRKRNTGTREELAVDYTSSFGGTQAYDGKYAVPYESVFTSAEGLLCQEGYHAVLDMFRKAGFKKREGDCTPDDHLGYICEFMAMLSERAAESAAAGDWAAALSDVRRAKACLREHVLSWYELLFGRASLLVKTRFYRGVLLLARGYFAFDEKTVDELIDVLEGA